MRRIHPLLIGGALLTGGAFLASTVPVRAQAKGGAVPSFYTGSTPLAEGIRLGGWGSGKAVPDTTNRTTGDGSIKIETSGFYSGSRIQFDTPKDITQVKNDPY